MSLQPNIRGSSNSLGDQRLPVPPPLPVAPPLTKASSKAGNVQGTSSTLTIASGSVSQVVARRPSPPRRTGEEMTFQQKLDEIKRMRNRTNKNGESRMSTALLNQAQQQAAQHNQQQLQQPPKRRVVINGKPALDMHGDWALMQSSSGKQYYFNVKTMINTWVKPKEWPTPQTQSLPLTSNPPLPVQKPNVSTTDSISSLHHHPQPPQPPPNSSNGNKNESESGARKFQMKISGSSSISKSGLPGIEEYDTANDESASNRDLSTKDDNQQGQKQNNASFDQDHKRKRHGKFRRKGANDDKNKSFDDQTESRISDKGENRTEDTSNGNKDTNGKHDEFSESRKKTEGRNKHRRRKNRRSFDEKEPPEKRTKGRHKSRSKSRSRSRSRSRSKSRHSDRSRSRSHDSYYSDYSHSSYSSYSDSYSDYSRSRSRSRSRERSHSPRSDRKNNLQNPSKDESGGALAAAVLAAKAKVESQMANASIATNSLGGQEPSEAPPPSHFRSTLPVPGASGTSNSIINPVSQSSTLLETVTGSSGEIKTWVSEYNFPAVLTRCKFPKEYDAIHELQTNKTKKRLNSTMVPLPADLNPTGDPEVSRTLRRNMFFAELKDSNNRYRLLCEKFGSTVYKIPDDLWERNYQQFQVELKPGYYLEARPHAYTEDDKPVYTRTGKVAKKVPFPEDVVRCHAVMQALSMDLCHCVYANKTYTIEKDDAQWKKDLDEARKFLDGKGFY